MFKVEAEGAEMIAICSKTYLQNKNMNAKYLAKELTDMSKSFLKVITEKT